jgi:phosphopentomutase
VAGIGKIGDIFGHQGLTEEIHSDNNMDGIDKTIDRINKYRGHKGLVFTNLVEFDSVYGHRRNVEGYAKALEEVDRRIPEITEVLNDEELLILTADHGCDPTHTVHTDHTREYVPLLVFGKSIRRNVNLGTRRTFSDCGQTIADLLGVKKLNQGQSFRKELLWN